MARPLRIEYPGAVYHVTSRPALSRPNVAMDEAWRTGAYSMAEIAASFGVHYMTVSRAVRKFEEK